jgi:hypothetical protein
MLVVIVHQDGKQELFDSAKEAKVQLTNYGLTKYEVRKITLGQRRALARIYRKEA